MNRSGQGDLRRWESWGKMSATFSVESWHKDRKLSFCLQEPGAGYLHPETRDQDTIGSVTGSKSQAGGCWKCFLLQHPDLALIPGSGRSPGKGNGYPLQDSCLENSMDRGAWGVAKSQA